MFDLVYLRLSSEFSKIKFLFLYDTQDIFGGVVLSLTVSPKGEVILKFLRSFEQAAKGKHPDATVCKSVKPYGHV